MGWTTLGAVLRAPMVIKKELDKRNAQKSDEFARSLMNFFGRKEKRINEAEVAQRNGGVSRGSGWGSEDW